MHLLSQLRPLAPGTSVDCLPRRFEASCRRWKGFASWGLVALSSSYSFADSAVQALWHRNEGARKAQGITLARILCHSAQRSRERAPPSHAVRDALQ